MDQPGKVANLARGQLNRENERFPVPVRAGGFGLARRFRRSHPASACSFFTLELLMVLTHGIPPDFHGGAYLLLVPPHTIESVPSLSGRHAIAYRWRSLPKFRWHRASRHQDSSRNGCCLCRSPWTNQRGPLVSHTILLLV